jgi:RNA ligase
VVEIKDIMNRGLLREMVVAGYVKRNSHPDDPLLEIWCYTHNAQFDNVWNEATTQARGLITYAEEIISRPFPKFFNYEQHFNVYKRLPQGHGLIREKLDGSFGILYQDDNGSLAVASKSSFTSPQALWATGWLGMNLSDYLFDTEKYTYLFEIIYPENRIVLPYDYSGLVLLEVLETETGEVAHGEFQRLEGLSVRVPRIIGSAGIDLADLSVLYQQVPDNEEGFVVRYDNGVRIKVKGEEYLRLHRIVTGMSEKSIWEMLRDGRRKELMETIKTMPDEFYAWATGIIYQVDHQYNEIMNKQAMPAYAQVKDMSRKDAAAFLKKNHKPIMGIVFAILDNKLDRARLSVFDMIKPENFLPLFAQQGGAE